MSALRKEQPLGEYIPQLDPCPFCGGTPEMSHVREVDDNRRLRAVIECCGCGVEMTNESSRHLWKKAPSRIATEIQIKRELELQWNARHQS